MLITNANLVTMGRPNQILENHAVWINNGQICELGPQADLLIRHPDAEKVDARGQYVLPGNICAHTHFYGAFSRGMPIPGTAPKDFPEILGRLWWPLDRALDLDDVYFSAMVCLIDAIRHGTTTLIDHHASPNAIAGSLDQIAKAVDESGLRAALCYEVTDRDGPERAMAGVAENLRFIRKIQCENPLPGRLSAMFGLHASLTLSDETLRNCRKAVDDHDVGFHIHVAEHSVDEYDAVQKSGTRVVDRLNHFGILGPKTIAVHAVHVDAREIALLAETGTWVSHQPRSNMNNGVGLPPVEALLRSGVRVCLGNDGFSNAMWEEWKAAYLAHKLYNGDPRRLPGNIVEQMAIENNQDLAKVIFRDRLIGQIAPGEVADLIFVDYKPFTPFTVENLAWHIVFGFHESMVTATIASGKMLMRDRKLLFIDEERVVAEARQRAPHLWERYKHQARQAAEPGILKSWEVL